MEPGRKDRDDKDAPYVHVVVTEPQWSPVEKTGMNNTSGMGEDRTPRAPKETGRKDRDDANSQPVASISAGSPQWSPVEKTGMTRTTKVAFELMNVPQWSPVEKTGMTYQRRVGAGRDDGAAMEPGRKDRD